MRRRTDTSPAGAAPAELQTFQPDEWLVGGSLTYERFIEALELWWEARAEWAAAHGQDVRDLPSSVPDAPFDASDV